MTSALDLAREHYYQAQVLVKCANDGHRGILVMTSDTHDSYICECCMMTITVEKKDETPSSRLHQRNS